MPSSTFQRTLSVLALLFALSATADVRLWPFFYAKTDPVDHQNKLEIFWPLYSRDANERRTAHRILSFQREFPDQYPWQAYFLWPLTGLRLGNGHDAWLFPFLWSGNDGDHRNHNSLFPLWIYYRNRDYRTLNVAILNHNSWSKQHHSHYLFPLWWAKWAEYDHYKMYSHGLFPLYSLYRNENNDPRRPEFSAQQRRGNVTLAYWNQQSYKDKKHRRRDQASFGIFPIAHRSQKDSLHWDEKTNTGYSTDHQTSLYLFPYKQKTRLRQQLPTPPEPDQDYREMTGTIRRQKHSRRLFPLYYDLSRTTYTADSTLSGARRNIWIFPYWYSYRAKIKPATENQSPPIKNTTNPKQSAREKYTSRHMVPLLFNRRNTTWINPDAETPLVASDNTFYLFPYYRSTYDSADSESANNFFLLGGWGHSTQAKPAYNKHYSYLFPFLFYKHQAKSAPPEKPDEDWADTKLWVFPYWRHRSHIGNQEKRTDFLFPLYLRSYQAHAEDRTWWTVLVGAGETQVPEYLKRKYDLNTRSSSNWQNQTESTRFFFPFWSQKHTGTTRSWNILPMLWHSHSIDAESTTTTSNTYPLLLSNSRRSITENGQESTRNTYLLGLGGWRRRRENVPANPQTTSLRHHLFPLWSHKKSSSGVKTSMLLPPFSYRVVNHTPARESSLAQTRSLAIPHAWLPIYKSKIRTNNDHTTKSSKSWLFPFYVYETNREDDFSRFSFLWWLYHRERSHGEIRAWGLGGGLANYYEKDVNGFVERSFLYRLYHREERSWFEEVEIMPFYYSNHQEDNSGGWSVLGGMFGSHRDGNVKTTRFFFIPFRTTVKSIQPLDATENTQRHLKYALNYLEARRFDRAAIEFIFAEGSYETDAVILDQAGDAFAQANADHFQEFFRRDLPSSLSKISDKAQRYRQDGSGRKLRQRAIELYRQAIANGANQDDLDLKIAVCHMLNGESGSAEAILKDRFKRTGDFHHGIDCLRLQKPYKEMSPEVIAELRRRYPQYALVHHLKAMNDMYKEQFGELCPYDCLSQSRMKDVSPEVQEKLAAALAEAMAILSQTIALPQVDYPPVRPVRLPKPLPNLIHNSHAHQTTTDGLPTPTAVRGLAAKAMLGILTQQYWELQNKKEPTPEDYAEKRRLLTEMMTYLPLLQDVKSENFHDFCRMHRQCYNDELRLLNDLLKIQAQIPASMQEAPADSLSTLAKDCAGMISSMRRQLSYLTRWDAKLVSGQPSSLGVGPFVTKDCGNGYVDLDFIFGCVDKCTVEATTTVVAEKAQEAVLLLGFDRELTAELNGHVVFGPKRDRIARRDEHRVPIQLQAGPNNLKFLVKDDKLSFGFYARLTTPDGEPIFFPNKK